MLTSTDIHLKPQFFQEQKATKHKRQRNDRRLASRTSEVVSNSALLLSYLCIVYLVADDAPRLDVSPHPYVVVSLVYAAFARELRVPQGHRHL